MTAFGTILAEIIAKIGWSLLTEKVLKEVFVHTAWYLAKKSSNTLDDSFAKTASDALGIKVD